MIDTPCYQPIYNVPNCHLNWALNETEIGCNYQITRIGYNEKSQFPSNLNLNLDSMGFIGTILSNWVSIEKIDSLWNFVNGMKVSGGKM